MVGPVNYSIDVASPLQSLLQGYDIGLQIRERRIQQQAMQAKAQAMAGLMRPGVTFADYQRVMQQFPEEVKGLTEQFNAMDKIQRDLMFNAGGEAYSLIREKEDGTFDAAPAVAKLEEYATAAENSGDQAGAKKFRDMAAYVKANPAAGKATIGSVLSVWDADRAKGLIEQASGAAAYDTAFLKELRAEGLVPGTQPWNDALKAKREGDPWIVVPGVGLYLKSDIQSAAEGGTVKPQIPEGAARMLRRNPQLRKDFDAKYGPGAADRILGGPTPTASGGFQPRS